MTETNRNGKDTIIPGTTEAEGERKQSAEENKAQAPKRTIDQPSIAVSPDGEIFQITIPMKIGLFIASGFINEVAFPYMRSLYRKQEEKKQSIITPASGFRGFNPFGRKR